MDITWPDGSSWYQEPLSTEYGRRKMITYGLQFDSTGTLPFEPALRLEYVNGRYAPQKITYGTGRVWIDVIGNMPTAAAWIDVERYDVPISRIPGWLDERAAAGLGTGGVYVSRSNLAAAEKAAGSRPHMLGIATLDGTIDIPAPRGFGILTFIQAFPAASVGINADVSVVVDRDYWQGRARHTA
jgi:hypothetical protein